MLVKEYRIPMPFSVEEYQIGQLFMIAKHSHEQSESGEGVEVVHNVAHTDDINGAGRYTEKRIHLSSRLPYFLQSIIPRVFYVTEKSWNYFPYTETEYTCSFLPKFNIFIKTRYENNNGTSENLLGVNPEDLPNLEVDVLDIAFDELQAKHYKANEDPKYFKSTKTGRGPLMSGWKDTLDPIMCSYKLVSCAFEVWCLQTKVEDYAQRAIREILLLGHRQAFAWIDEWHGMTEDDVRLYEAKMQAETNEKVLGTHEEDKSETGDEVTEEEGQEAEEESEKQNPSSPSSTKSGAKSGPSSPSSISGPTAAGSAVTGLKSWFNWG